MPVPMVVAQRAKKEYIKTTQIMMAKSLVWLLKERVGKESGGGRAISSDLRLFKSLFIELASDLLLVNATHTQAQ